MRDNFGFEHVMDGAKQFSKLTAWPLWHGIHGYDKNTSEWQLLEGMKASNIWEDGERGKFEYIEELKRWELVEGVKSSEKSKMRGKWIYDPRNHEMHCVRLVKKCEYGKCKRNSENTKRIFRVCGKCKKKFYCSRRHQRNDWQMDHKYQCSFY